MTEDPDDHTKAQARVLASILESAETLRGDLRKLAKAARNDIQMHQAVMEGGLLFPEALQELKFAGEADPFVRKWADSFRDIRQMYAQMNSLQGVLFESIESWVSDPYLRLGDLAKQVEADKLVYEQALKKAKSKSQRTPPDGTSPLELKVAEARRDYEASMLLYVGRLTETMNHLRAEFLDRLTSCMFAAESFFTAGGEIMKVLTPAMSEKRQLLDRERAAFVDRLTNIAESEKAVPSSKGAESPATAPTVPRVGIVREGRLFLKKQTTLGSPWRLRTFQIKEDGTLVWFKKIGRGKVTSLNLVLSTARPLHDAKHENAFEILTPDQSKHVLRAASPEEMNAWLNAFKLSISSGLAQGTSMTSDADREKTKTAPELAPELKLLVERNPECADCGAEQPSWCSINIGVLVCHECSGAHRSLGTHISKIKSLTLDKWESHALEIMKALGNKRCNNFWEHTIPEGSHKPLPTSKTPLKHQWIVAKYRDKAFTPRVSTPISPSVLFQKLFVALSKDDMLTAARVIALGAEVSAHTNPDGKTLLHGAAEEGRSLTLEFLIINGADFTARDDDGRLPLHHAAMNGHLECVKQLIARQGDVAANDPDNGGFTPIDLAKSNEQEAVVNHLRPALKAAPPVEARPRKKELFRRTLSTKVSKEIAQSKLRRVTSGNNAADAAIARDMVEQEREKERQRRPSVFKTNPLDSVHLYRPSTSGSTLQRPSSVESPPTSPSSAAAVAAADNAPATPAKERETRASGTQ